MAFTYRPEKHTEEVISLYMKKSQLKSKQEAIDWLIDSRPELDAEIKNLRFELDSLKGLLFNKDLPIQLQDMIDALKRSQKKIEKFQRKLSGS